MKKITLVGLAMIVPLFLSGCWLFEDNELADAEMSSDINVVVNENVNEETEEEIKEEEEELTVDKVVQGTWWLYMQYPEMRGLSQVKIVTDDQDDQGNYDGTMETISSELFSNDGTDSVIGEPNGELADFEIDGQKIRMNASGISLDGKIKLQENKSYASGDFISTAGSGNWYLTNVKSDNNWLEI